MNHKFKRVSFWDRLLARVLDILIFWVISLIISRIPFVGVFVVYILWLMRDGYNEGGGFGKNKRHIAVIELDTFQVCNYPRSIIRNIVSDASAFLLVLQFMPPASDPLLHEVYIASAYYGAALLVTLVDTWRVLYADGGRRVGDMIARTQVVYWEEYIDAKWKFEEEEKKQLEESVKRVRQAREQKDGTGIF
jgi:uncharacterized RDD family membrane protein YckC